MKNKDFCFGAQIRKLLQLNYRLLFKQ